MNEFEKSTKIKNIEMIKLLPKLGLEVVNEGFSMHKPFDGLVCFEDYTRVLIETKDRIKDLYSEYILEDKMLKRLIKKANDMNIEEIYYVNLFSKQSRAIVWKLTDELLNISETQRKDLNENTVYKGKNVSKRIYLLNKKQGQCIKY